MGQYAGTVVTNAGQSLFAQCLAEGATVQFTSIKTSSYAIPDSVDLETLTDLQSIKQTVAPSFTQVVDNNVVQVSVNISNAEVVTEYNVEALGIYASKGNGNPILFAVVKAITPDIIESGRGGTNIVAYIYNIQMFLSNAASVTVSIADPGYVDIITFNTRIAAINTVLAQKADITMLQGLDTPENITIAVADWTASGALFTAVKNCTKASTSAYANLTFVPQNPNPATKAGLQTLQKNLSYLFTRPTIGNGTVTFTAVTKPTIPLTFSVVGGAVS